ncbi:MAG: BMP family ABC transporter substrate-binding protein [Anaeromicrobium sp.]|jgi:basic membrane protein A|uniref:BMP family lipoprotein n=1 Tax=Anaeromicrobium sp. TaxID=1929132 RepID=UPI0025CBF468|nr:BMP family ABC transporter substrate-binding protein [Anaeromicrobium sp.]MCT4594015.1 BMP family ABC transporter substrate-binding protein [Anaeromicrobium sp.]
MKKVIAILLILVVLVSVAACGRKSDENASKGNQLSIGMVTDVGGVNDLSFNQSAWEGLGKAKDDFGVDVNYLESKQESDYETNLQFLVDEETDLTLAIGYMMSDALKNAALNFPNNKFAIVDNSYGEETPSNVVGITFKEHEASFLVGYIAGKMTKTNKVGFVGGVDFYVINKFQYGFMSGVKYANPDAEIFVQYAGSFGDAAAGKSIAEQFYNSGADIVYHASGATGNGVIEAAKEKNKWVIGVDRDQSDLAPENVLTSAVKRVDHAAYSIIEDLQNGKWMGGKSVSYGLAEGGVDIAPTSDKHVPKEILDEVEELRKKIIDGIVMVPENKEEYEKEF